MKRFCARQGCPTLVDRGYCEVHQPEAPSADRLPLDPRYWSPEWRRYSRGYLATHTRCASCGRLSQVVDHIVPVRQAPERFFDETNHQSLCIGCNTRKDAARERAIR